jgi:hypothetical protein
MFKTKQRCACILKLLLCCCELLEVSDIVIFTIALAVDMSQYRPCTPRACSRPLSLLY